MNDDDNDSINPRQERASIIRPQARATGAGCQQIVLCLCPCDIGGANSGIAVTGSEFHRSNLKISLRVGKAVLSTRNVGVSLRIATRTLRRIEAHKYLFREREEPQNVKQLH